MSINFADMTEEELITPLNYFGGNRFMKSDRDWIKMQLMFLDINQKKAVCEEYREIYLKQGRKTANEYLQSYVELNGDTNRINRRRFVNHEIPANLQARIERIKASRQKASILGMADNKK